VINNISEDGIIPSSLPKGDFMKVKCQSCSKMIDRNTAYKVTMGKVNKYYCNENEYADIQSAKKIKDNTYEKIFECFNRKITNSVLFKEINELEQVYGYIKITDYIEENMDYLSSVLINKSFSSEYAQIRYFTAILKNSLADYSVETKKHEKPVILDIPEVKYKAVKKKRSLDEIEQEVGEML